MLGESLDYRFVIQPRGGGAPLGELNPLSIEDASWERRLDEFSTAQVNFQVSGCDCSTLELADPIATELLILRSGEPVWVGPVVRWEMGRSDGFLIARDLSAWLNWRTFRQDFSEVGVDLATVASKFASSGLSSDNPNITVSSVATGVSGDRAAVESDYIIVMDDIEELLRTDVDMVTIGRIITFYGTETPQVFLPDFTDDSFEEDVRISRNGLPMATRVIVKGEGSLVGIYPSFSQAGSSRYGMKERVFDEPTILDQESLDAAAKTRYELLKVPLSRVETPTGRLSPSCPVHINELIPGVRQKLTLTSLCFPVSAVFRLDKVDVKVSADREEVSVSYQPVGSTLEDANK